MQIIITLVGIFVSIFFGMTIMMFNPNSLLNWYNQMVGLLENLEQTMVSMGFPAVSPSGQFWHIFLPLILDPYISKTNMRHVLQP